MNTNFGERIKQLRKKRGLNQSELAKILGVSRTMISAYESDMRKPSYENLIAIVMYFNISMDWMFGNAGDKDPVILDLSKFEDDQAAVIQNIAWTYAQKNMLHDYYEAQMRIRDKQLEEDHAAYYEYVEMNEKKPTI